MLHLSDLWKWKIHFLLITIVSVCREIHPVKQVGVRISQTPQQTFRGKIPPATTPRIKYIFSDYDFSDYGETVYIRMPQKPEPTPAAQSQFSQQRRQRPTTLIVSKVRPRPRVQLAKQDDGLPPCSDVSHRNVDEAATEGLEDITEAPTPPPTPPPPKTQHLNYDYYDYYVDPPGAPPAPSGPPPGWGPPPAPPPPPAPAGWPAPGWPAPPPPPPAGWPAPPAFSWPAPPPPPPPPPSKGWPAPKGPPPGWGWPEPPKGPPPGWGWPEPAKEIVYVKSKSKPVKVIQSKPQIIKEKEYVYVDKPVYIPAPKAKETKPIYIEKPVYLPSPPKAQLPVFIEKPVYYPVPGKDKDKDKDKKPGKGGAFPVPSPFPVPIPFPIPGFPPIPPIPPVPPIPPIVPPIPPVPLPLPPPRATLGKYLRETWNNFIDIFRFADVNTSVDLRATNETEGVNRTSVRITAYSGNTTSNNSNGTVERKGKKNPENTSYLPLNLSVNWPSSYFSSSEEEESRRK